MEIFDFESEKALLSCIFVGGERVLIQLGEYNANLFFSQSCRNVFKAIQSVAKEGRAIDIVTISDKMKQLKTFEKSGGISFLAEVAGFSASSVNAMAYADIIREKAFCRKICEGVKAINEKALSGDYKGLLDSLSEFQNISSVASSKGFESISEVFEGFLTKKLLARESGEVLTGQKTGFPTLDRITGGLQKGDLIILAARPSMGKTAFMLDLARGISANNNENECYVFSLEMSAESISARVASGTFKIDNTKWKHPTTLTNEDILYIQKRASAFEKLYKNIKIYDEPQMSVSDITAKCFEQVDRNGGKKPALICIDYLQLIFGGNDRDNANTMLSKISRELKLLARKMDCPVICLSQLSRKCEERADKRPMLSDIRDSGAIEQDADIVMFLYRDEYYFPNTEKKNQAELIIAKHRNGPLTTIDLVFKNEYTSFRELDKNFKF